MNSLKCKGKIKIKEPKEYLDFGSVGFCLILFHLMAINLTDGMDKNTIL